MVIDSVATMKNTNRKNMVSIIGMISMRAFLRVGLGIRIAHLPSPEHQFQPRGIFFDATSGPLHFGHEIVVRDKGRDGHKQTSRRGEQRFSHAARHSMRLSYAGRCHDLKGLDHADDRSKQTQKGGKGYDRIEHRLASFLAPEYVRRRALVGSCWGMTHRVRPLC